MDIMNNNNNKQILNYHFATIIVNWITLLLQLILEMCVLLVTIKFLNMKMAVVSYFMMVPPINLE